MVVFGAADVVAYHISSSTRLSMNIRFVCLQLFTTLRGVQLKLGSGSHRSASALRSCFAILTVLIRNNGAALSQTGLTSFIMVQYNVQISNSKHAMLAGKIRAVVGRMRSS
jgi:hypothetical protein